MGDGPGLIAARPPCGLSAYAVLRRGRSLVRCQPLVRLRPVRACEPPLLFRRGCRYGFLCASQAFLLAATTSSTFFSVAAVSFLAAAGQLGQQK